MLSVGLVYEICLDCNGLNILCLRYVCLCKYICKYLGGINKIDRVGLD